MRFSEVSVSYSWRTGPPVLRELSFSLAPGVTGLIGLNGAGKSTLLRAISGSVKPRAGTIHRESALRISLMPQETAMPQEFSSSEYLQYDGWLQGEKVDSERAVACLKDVNLEQQAATRASRLSGGQQRRLLFASCLLRQPDILLLDEPTAGLDIEQRESLLSIIRKTSVKSTVISTHITSDISSVADNIIAISHQRIVFDGSFRSFCDEINCDLDKIDDRAVVDFLKRPSS